MWSAARVLKTFAVLAVLLPAVLVGVWLWDQNHPDAVFLQAISAVERGDFSHVSEAAARLERYPEFRRHAHLLSGCLLLEAGDSSGALREFSLARPDGVLRFPALQYTAQALYLSGRLSEAGHLLAVLVNENPLSAEAHRWLGAIYYDLGMQSAAFAELSEATHLNPLDHRPHRLLGLMCTERSLFLAAIEHYRTALKLAKGIPQPDIETDLAILLIGRNEFEEALESLKNAQATSTVWALRADCYDGLGNPGASRDSVAKAMLADPNDFRALLLYGTQQLYDGNAQGAIEPLHKVLNQDPHHPAARYQLAMAYLKLGQTEAWQREMDKRDASNKLHDRFHESVKQAAAEPENIQIRRELAAIARSLGKPEVAKRWDVAAIACQTAVNDERN